MAGLSAEHRCRTSDVARMRSLSWTQWLGMLSLAAVSGCDDGPVSHRPGSEQGGDAALLGDGGLGGQGTAETSGASAGVEAVEAGGGVGGSDAPDPVSGQTAGSAEVGAGGAGGQPGESSGESCLDDVEPTASTGDCEHALDDPHNCGACAVDCRGGWCDEGRCHTVSPLIASLAQPTALVLDGATLHFLQGGADLEDGAYASLVLECPFSAIGLSTKRNEGWALSVFEEKAHWFARADAGVELLSFTSGQLTTVASELDEPGFQIATTSDWIYFPIQGTAPSFKTGGGVFRCRTGGCGEGPTALSQGGEYYRPTGIAVAGPDLFWSIKGTLPAFVDGKIAHCVADDCTGTSSVLVQGAKSPKLLVASDEYLYWLEEGTGPTYKDGAVRRCSLNDCAATIGTLASRLVQPTTFVVDEDYVFVAEQHSVYRVPIVGGTRQLVSTRGATISAMAQDGEYVYWSERADEPAAGAILRVRK